MKRIKQSETYSVPYERACFCCRKGFYTSVPVYLTGSDGKTSILAYRAQCPFCESVEIVHSAEGVEQRPAVYKLNGKIPDFRADLWPEVRKYSLSHKILVNRIFERRNQRYFTLDDFR